jgi:hypothetical protein
MSEYTYVGQVIGAVADTNFVLVEWESDEAPKENTLLFVKRWTQKEIDDCDRQADELSKKLGVK